jgi:predicted dehydrogenase
MKNKIKAAVVGYGLSGKVFHAPFLHVHDGFDLRKIVERNKEESKEKYPSVDVVKDLDAVLSDGDIDLVVICTPNVLHFEHVQQCLDAGKHVVIEKPFMNTTAECDAIIDRAKQKNLQVFVYQNRRWDGDFLTIRKIFRSGVLGVLRHYEAHFDRYSPVRTRAAWRDEPLPGSGILYDLGPHLIDQALCLFGHPDALTAEIKAQRQGSVVDDYFRIVLEYSGHEVILTAGMLVEEHDLRYILHGTSGSFIKYGIDPQEAMLRKGEWPVGNNWGKEDPGHFGLITLDDENEDYDGVIETLPGNYMGFYDNVYDVLNAGAELSVKPVEARNVIRLIELAFESSKHSMTLKPDLV